MESVRREPVPALRRLVHHYHGFHLPAAAERSRLEIPSGAATLLIAFAEPIRIGPLSDGESEVFQRGSFLAAGRAVAAVGRHRGRVQGERHLRSRFLEQVGMPPKAMARVLRLQAALRAHLAGSSWAQAAVSARYHDQAHLVHDVKAITGLTPGRLAELRHGAPPGSALDRLPGRVTSVLLG